MVLGNTGSFLSAYGDIIVLIIIMTLTAAAIYRFRSRLFFLGVTLAGLLYFGIVRQGCPCAVGSVQNVLALFLHPEARIDLPVLLFFLLPLAAALFLGRLYCGGACPLGAIQELLFIKRLPIPRTVWQTLTIVPIFYIGAAAAAAWTGAPNIICLSDPFLPVFHAGGVTGMGILTAVFLATSLILYRPYCRIICPYGVMLSLAALFSGKRATITGHTCSDCKLCNELCPADAISPPDNPIDTEEARAKILPLLLITASLMVVLAFAGNLAGRYLSFVHTDVRLNSLIIQQKTESTEVESFLEQGGKPEELAITAGKIKTRFITIMTISGVVAGLFLGISLASTDFRRYRESAQIRQKECFLCTRCMNTCPREKSKKLSEKVI